MAGIFLRCRRRKKHGKVFEFWSSVKSRRLAHGRIAQRQVLYRGEINASQREAWRKTIEVQDASHLPNPWDRLVSPTVLAQKQRQRRRSVASKQCKAKVGAAGHLALAFGGRVEGGV